MRVGQEREAERNAKVLQIRFQWEGEWQSSVRDPKQENLAATIRRSRASCVIRGGDLAGKDRGRRQKPCYLLRKVATGQLEALLSRFVVT